MRLQGHEAHLAMEHTEVSYKTSREHHFPQDWYAVCSRFKDIQSGNPPGFGAVWGADKAHRSAPFCRCSM